MENHTNLPDEIPSDPQQRFADLAMLSQIEMRPHHYAGILVAVEGADGAGKTTLIRRLTRHLKAEGRTVLHVKVPTSDIRRSRLFQLNKVELRRELVSPLALQIMHTADRIQLCTEIIAPALEAGSVVLADRYVASGVAAVISNNLAPEEWFFSLIGNMIHPDVAVYLYAPWEVRQNRVRRRANERTVVFANDPRSHGSHELSMWIAKALKMEVIDTVSNDQRDVTLRVLQLMSELEARRTQTPLD